MSLLKRYLLFVFSFIFPLILHAQHSCTFTLQGHVYDEDTQLPLNGVTLSLPALQKQTTTNEHGFFQFNNLCKQSLEINFRAVGFQDLALEWSLPSDTPLKVFLQHSSIHLHEVHIVAHQQKLKTTASVSTLTKDDLALSKGESLANVLKATPGVTMLQTGATIAKPVIHGMHSNRVLMVNNGIKQEGQQWGAEHAPEIDPFVASTIHVIKGAESVRYGSEAIGGVVLVEPAPLPTDEGFSGELDWVGALNGRSSTSSLTLQSSVPGVQGLAWRAQATHKVGGNIKTPDYYLTNTGMDEFNYSVAASYKRSSTLLEAYYSRFSTNLGIFSGAHIGSLEDLEARIAYGRPFTDGKFSYKIEAPRQHVRHDLVKVKAHHDFENGGQIDIQYGYQRNARQEFDIRRGDRSGIPALDLVLFAHALDFQYTKRSANHLNTSIGLNLSNTVNNTVPGTFSTPLIPNYDHTGVGIYLIERLIKPKYELEFGIRYDHKHLDAAGFDRNKERYGGTHNYNNFSGAVGGLWRAGSGWEVRSNLGLAWRPPTVNELYSNGLHHGAASIELGDATLKAEKGYKWVNTLSFKNNLLSFELTAFGHSLINYIYMRPTGTFDESLRGTFPVFEYQQTNAVLYGADFSGIISLSSPFEYHLKASFLRAKDRKNDTYLPAIPSDRIDNSIQYKHPQTLAFLHQFYLQLTSQTVFKQNRFSSETDFAAAPQGYHLLNLQTGAGISIGQQQLQVRLSADNLLNKTYKEYMNRFRYYAHEKGRNISLGLSMEF